MGFGRYRFRRSFGQVNSQFRGARPSTYPLTDPDVLAFAAESGATDLTGLDNLVTYLKGEGLYDDFVIYPMKSAQNAGSGSTVYSLGGLTDNDLTIQGGAAWDANGFDTNGVDQYFLASDFLANNSTSMWLRHTPASADISSAAFLCGQNGGVGFLNVYSFYGASNDDLIVSRSSDGGTTNRESYGSVTGFVTATEKTISTNWVSGAGRTARADGVSISLPTLTGLDQTSGFDTSVDFSACATSTGALPAEFNDVKACAVHSGTTAITTTQEDAITALINAL